MLATGLLLMWLALFAAGDTPVGRAMRAIGVDAPARRLSRWSRGQVLLVVLTLAVAAAIIWVMEDEGRLLLGMFGPEVVGALTAFEVSAWLDGLMVVAATGSALRVRGMRHWLAARMRRGGRARTVRARRVRRPGAANDDADGPAAQAA